VAYQVKAAWGNGATVSLSISNTGPTDIERWSLSFDLKDGLKPQSSWNSTWHQQGQRVTVVGTSSNAALAAGKSVNDVGTNLYGANAANGIGDNFVLNGMPCRTPSQRT
jgi:hypothetical protein